jgi:hypothetical protein
MRLLRVYHIRNYLPALFLLPLLCAADDLKPQAPPLRVVHSRHYDIHTDMDQPLIDDLSSRMDSMYEQYVKTFSEFKLPADSPPLAVYLFTTHDRYMAFTDFAGTNTGGLFVPGRRPYLAAYEQGQGRDALRRTLQHEAFHQFAHAAISRQLPPWMNEGLAQLFEESIWEGNDFITDQIPPRRLRQLNADIIQKRLIDFDLMLAMSPREWSSMLHKDVAKAAIAYNQAWAMAYFCSQAGDPLYHKSFTQLLSRLHGNLDPADETRKAFADLKDFRKKFNAWAAKLKPTPEATQLENLDILGDFLLAVTQHNRPAPADMAVFRQLVVEQNLKIQYTKNKLTFSTAERPIQYFSDLSAKPYTADELFFQPDVTAPLPDIICQPAGSAYRYRTHFYQDVGKTEHELLIETKP